MVCVVITTFSSQTKISNLAIYADSFGFPSKVIELYSKDTCTVIGITWWCSTNTKNGIKRMVSKEWYV
jgi:hypothetical protein